MPGYRLSHYTLHVVALALAVLAVYLLVMPLGIEQGWKGVIGSAVGGTSQIASLLINGWREELL